jgi:predicted O-methyltransferase YrrM
MLTDASAVAVPVEKRQSTRFKSTGKNGQTFTWLWAQDISQMMKREECERLADLAQGKTVLEVGACLGCSTISLASTAEYVVSVDWHRGDTQTVGWGFTAVQYLANLIRYGVLDKVSAVVADCNRIGALFADDHFDMAFIDGDHRLDCVRRNIELFLPKVRSPGVIAFHDYGAKDCFEKQAVDERFNQPDELVGTLAIINV